MFNIHIKEEKYLIKIAFLVSLFTSASEMCCIPQIEKISCSINKNKNQSHCKHLTKILL